MDVLAFGSTFEESRSRLGELLRHLQNNNLKLKLAKSKLFRKSLGVSGHVISENGIVTPKRLKLSNLGQGQNIRTKLKVC